MNTRLARLVSIVGETFRVAGSALAGLMPAVRSADGTYGTQRMHSRQVAERRRADFPTG